MRSAFLQLDFASLCDGGNRRRFLVVQGENFVRKGTLKEKGLKENAQKTMWIFSKFLENMAKIVLFFLL